MPSLTGSRKEPERKAVPHRAYRSDGLLLLDKPSGPGSAEMVSRARRATGIRRIGHTGTLDRFASGLLILVVGRATVLADTILKFEKTYEATFRAGKFTDTHDPSGAVEEERSVGQCLAFLEQGRVSMEQWILDYRGDQKQVPPDYSALKRQGMRVSDRVRRGEFVELQPRSIHVADSQLLSLDEDETGFSLRARFTVSSGTYIRAIARDFSRAMGFPFYLEQLRRTSIGPFALDDAWNPRFKDGEPEYPIHILSLPDAFPDWFTVQLDESRSAQIEQGKRIPVDLPGKQNQPFFILREDGSVLAIARRQGNGYDFLKVFVREAAGKE
jgi:tRNA pseudouridine55 synthase